MGQIDVLGLLSVDSFGILILMVLWVLLGLAGTLAELTYDPSIMSDYVEFLPEPDRRTF